VYGKILLAHFAQSQYLCSMNLKIFALGRELMGCSELVVPLAEPITVAALKERLYNDYPVLQNLPSLVIAVNSQYADEDTLIDDADEVALIPPVSGG
jgi:molybdopterin converting factor subunit 1